MSRKTARTNFSFIYKFAKISLIAVVLISLAGCGDKDDNEPPTPEENIPNFSIVGKWQKYMRLNDDGNFTVGDLNEFWIFYNDGTFENEDNGEICAIGIYILKDNTLTIYSVSASDNEPENFTGTVSIEDNFMVYTFSEIGETDYSTYRFRRMQTPS